MEAKEELQQRPHIHGIPRVKKVFIEVMSIYALLYLMKYFITSLK